MPALDINIESTPDRLRPFRRNEVDFTARFSMSPGKEHYWIEALVEVEPPLSLAPDRHLKMGKINVGILSEGLSKEKRFKVFSNNDIFPNTFTLRITALVYDGDGAVADRKEVKYELECSDKDGKIL
ncbi:MAG: hypothetical protein ACP5P2_00635 [Candidatus Micrarchaeia archaeon]|jgi:hypothetical protein